MSSTPSSSSKSTPSTSKLSLLSASKPFIKSKSQTSSSIVFPSFRFSPESEEIQEVREAGEDSAENNILQADATPQPSISPTPPQQPPPSPNKPSSGGDTSPIKEYVKRSWANKWDKRSLSLDLDLKGKIITAIEDKRRSFVSHFYNEEDEQDPNALVTSQSIPEQLVGGLGGSSEASTSSPGRSIRPSVHNLYEENNSDYYYYEFDPDSPKAASLPSSPTEFKATNTITTVTDPALNQANVRDLIIEEVGVECCCDFDGEVGASGSPVLRAFVLPPEELVESFNGCATMYNCASVGEGKRQRKGVDVVDSGGAQDIGDGVDGARPRDDVEESVNFKEIVVGGVVRDAMSHGLAKWFVGVLGVVVFLSPSVFLSNLLCFVLGWMGFSIVTSVFTRGEDAITDERVKDGKIESFGGERQLGLGSVEVQRAQGWMLTYPHDSPSYSAFTYHLRTTRTVFVRVHGSTLLISHPHSKHRIPKRRHYKDPDMKLDYLFTRHAQYDLSGAKIEIVPEGLARKRVWCKKYPISVTLASDVAFVGVRSPSPVEEDKGNENIVNFSNHGGGDCVNVSVAGGAAGGEVLREECAGKVIYLFARTDREKDDWFRRLVHASKLPTQPDHSSSSTTPNSSYSSTPTDFIAYMKRACPTLECAFAYTDTRHSTPTADLGSGELSLTSSAKQSPTSSRKSTPPEEKPTDPQAALLSSLVSPGSVNPCFLNAVISRLFYEFLKSPRWTSEIRSMIDRKLYFIRKPAFIQSLTVKELELGEAMPVINVASAPLLDGQGLWVDLDVEYTGNMVITIETFVNLMKLASSHDGKVKRHDEVDDGGHDEVRGHAMFDNEADDSGESSESSGDEDEVDHSVTPHKSEVAEDTASDRGKLLKYADAITKSSVMRNKHVQKVVGNIAATPIMLTVEIKRVAGVLAVNVPPVPNDRVWVGFRGNPAVQINARPKVGERRLTLSHLTEWIKRKLLLEFERVMVFPNMMDVSVSLMEFSLPK